MVFLRKFLENFVQWTLAFLLIWLVASFIISLCKVSVHQCGTPLGVERYFIDTDFFCPRSK